MDGQPCPICLHVISLVAMVRQCGTSGPPGPPRPWRILANSAAGQPAGDWQTRPAAARRRHSTWPTRRNALPVSTVEAQFGPGDVSTSCCKRSLHPILRVFIYFLYIYIKKVTVGRTAFPPSPSAAASSTGSRQSPPAMHATTVSISHSPLSPRTVSWSAPPPPSRGTHAGWVCSATEHVLAYSCSRGSP